MPPSQNLGQNLNRLVENLNRVILGKPDAITQAVVALIGGGHLLIEDVPGTGKSTLARALAKSMSGVFHRIQGTSDLLPSDVTGVSIYQEDEGAFQFVEGPLFGNIVLADELNRATPRAQSSLLEAMGEGKVSVDGRTHELPRPFMVIATQNPLAFEGTYPLPESQLDRFLVRISLGYPDPQDEKAMLELPDTRESLESLTPVLTPDAVVDLQAQAKQVRVDSSLLDYVLEVLTATREHPDLQLGASPRSGLAWIAAARSQGLLRERDFVTPDDIKELAIPVLAHRLIPLQATDDQTRLSSEILRSILDRVPVPL